MLTSVGTNLLCVNQRQPLLNAAFRHETFDLGMQRDDGAAFRYFEPQFSREALHSRILHRFEQPCSDYADGSDCSEDSGATSHTEDYREGFTPV